MQGAPKRKVPASAVEQGAGDFFIPDLCATRPVFVMILLSQLMVTVYVLAGSTLPTFNWDQFGVCSLFVQWVVLLSAALLCQLRAPFSRISLPASTAASLVLVIAVTALSSWVALQLYPRINAGTEAGWWILRNMLVAVVLTAVLLRYFFLQRQLLLQEQLELTSRLDSLRTRIRPHFLFNTLNSIASLIMSRPQAAEQAVEDLSELFRVSLREDQRSTTVNDELRLCELYLGIEELRLGDRLRVDWQIEDKARDQPMPSLVLQPLVENAVYHGVSLLPSGGLVEIAVDKVGSEVHATVRNPVPQEHRPPGGHQIALDNIEQRIQAIYGSGARLDAGRQQDHFVVTLRYAPGAAL